MLIIILFSWNRVNTSQISWLFLIFSYKQVFWLWTRKNRKLSFLDVEVSREKETFETTVFRKPIFSGVYTHFESFFPLVYIFGMFYTCLLLFQNLPWLNKVLWRTYFFEVSFFLTKQVPFVIYGQLFMISWQQLRRKPYFCH